MENRREFLLSGATIALPKLWQSITIILTVLVVGALIFLSLVPYTRTFAVDAEVIFGLGPAEIRAVQNGIVTSISVQEGQSVNAGTELATLQSRGALTDGKDNMPAIDNALFTQQSALNDRRLMIQERTDAQVRRLQRESAGLREEISLINKQLDLQVGLISSAEAEIERVADAADRGFISRRYMQGLRDGVVSRKLQLAVLQQSRASKLSALESSELSVSEARKQGTADENATIVEAAVLTRQTLDNEKLKGAVVVSSRSGTVTSIDIAPGQYVQAGEHLLTIADSKPNATGVRLRLSVEDSMLGKIKTGQSVSVRITTPGETSFRFAKARISSVSFAPTRRPQIGEVGRPKYIAFAEFDPSEFDRHRWPMQLRPGTRFAARVEIGRQNFLSMMFDRDL